MTIKIQRWNDLLPNKSAKSRFDAVAKNDLAALEARALEAEAECERLKKAELRATKGVVYLAGLLSVKTKEKLSVDWIQEALNLED